MAASAVEPLDLGLGLEDNAVAIDRPHQELDIVGHHKRAALERRPGLGGQQQADRGARRAAQQQIEALAAGLGDVGDIFQDALIHLHAADLVLALRQDRGRDRALEVDRLQVVRVEALVIAPQHLDLDLLQGHTRPAPCTESDRAGPRAAGRCPRTRPGSAWPAQRTARAAAARWPSIVTWRSSMASSSALWVLARRAVDLVAQQHIGEDRALAQPELAVPISKTCVPITSEGIRSGVNWTRLNSAWVRAAIVLAISVLAVPGTPSSSTWPPLNSAIRMWVKGSSWPTSTFAASARMWLAVSWTVCDSFTANDLAISQGCILSEGAAGADFITRIQETCAEGPAADEANGGRSFDRVLLAFATGFINNAMNCMRIAVGMQVGSTVLRGFSGRVVGGLNGLCGFRGLFLPPVGQYGRRTSSSPAPPAHSRSWWR